MFELKSKKEIFFLLFLGIFLVETPVFADTEFKFDGATLLYHTQPVFNQYIANITKQDGNDDQTVFEGEITRKIYQISNTSVFEVIRNYEEKLKADGYEILSSSQKKEWLWRETKICAENKSCGEFSGRETVSDGTGNNHVMIARKTTGVGGNLVMSVAGTQMKADFAWESPEAVKVPFKATQLFFVVDEVKPKELNQKMVEEKLPEKPQIENASVEEKSPDQQKITVQQQSVELDNGKGGMFGESTYLLVALICLLLGWIIYLTKRNKK